jgi:hypothetical protein
MSDYGSKDFYIEADYSGHATTDIEIGEHGVWNHHLTFAQAEALAREILHLCSSAPARPTTPARGCSCVGEHAESCPGDWPTTPACPHPQPHAKASDEPGDEYCRRCGKHNPDARPTTPAREARAVANPEFWEQQERTINTPANRKLMAKLEAAERAAEPVEREGEE